MGEVSEPQVVFDCMVYLQAAARRLGPARACLRLAENGLVRLYVSAEVLAEVRDVLNRPELRRRFPALTPELVAEFIDGISSFATTVGEVPRVFEYCRDPKDEKYVDLAVAAGAAYLVTRDNDLLDLVADPAFAQRFADLSILDPVAFLHLVADQASPTPPDADP